MLALINIYCWRESLTYRSGKNPKIVSHLKMICSQVLHLLLLLIFTEFIQVSISAWTWCLNFLSNKKHMYVKTGSELAHQSAGKTNDQWPTIDRPFWPTLDGKNLAPVEHLIWKIFHFLQDTLPNINIASKKWWLGNSFPFKSFKNRPNYSWLALGSVLNNMKIKHLHWLQDFIHQQYSLGCPPSQDSSGKWRFIFIGIPDPKNGS